MSDRIDHLISEGRITEYQGNILRQLREDLRVSRERQRDRRADRLLAVWFVICLVVGAAAFAAFVHWSYGSR